MIVFRRLFIISFFCMLLSCEKNDDNNIPSRVALLTRTDWKLQDFTSTPAYPLTINNQVQYVDNIMAVYKSSKSCHADQRFHFNKGTEEDNYEKGVYTFSDGNSTCSASAFNETGKWFFQQTNQEIILWEAQLNNINSLRTHYTVYRLTYDKLVISEKIKFSTNGTEYELKKTFVPITE